MRPPACLPCQPLISTGVRQQLNDWLLKVWLDRVLQILCRKRRGRTCLESDAAVLHRGVLAHGVLQEGALGGSAFSGSLPHNLAKELEATLTRQYVSRKTVDKLADGCAAAVILALLFPPTPFRCSSGYTRGHANIGVPVRVLTSHPHLRAQAWLGRMPAGYLVNCQAPAVGGRRSAAVSAVLALCSCMAPLAAALQTPHNCPAHETPTWRLTPQTVTPPCPNPPNPASQAPMGGPGTPAGGAPRRRRAGSQASLAPEPSARRSIRRGGGNRLRRKPRLP